MIARVPGRCFFAGHDWQLDPQDTEQDRLLCRKCPARDSREVRIERSGTPFRGLWPEIKWQVFRFRTDHFFKRADWKQLSQFTLDQVTEGAINGDLVAGTGMLSLKQPFARNVLLPTAFSLEDDSGVAWTVAGELWWGAQTCGQVVHVFRYRDTEN